MAGISVLVVEDNKNKYTDLSVTVLQEVGDEIEGVTWAEDFTQAYDCLKGKHYDLVILDIRLPYLKGGDPEAKASSDIIEIITRGQAIIPSYIIGLTEFSDEVSKSGAYPIQYFAIEKYSTVDRAWVEKIKRHIEYLNRSKEASVNFHFRAHHYDVVILTARSENEFKPIDAAMRWGSVTDTVDPSFGAFTVKTGAWVTSHGIELRAALICCERVGLSAAASATSFALARFRPKIVAMLGMCCGLSKADGADPLQLGDVIVMSNTYCWDEGRYSESNHLPALTGDDETDIAFFEARPSSGNASPRLRRAAENMIETGKRPVRQKLADAYRVHDSAQAILDAGKTLPKNPDIRMGLNVSGSSVVAATKQTNEILSRFPYALALEMECHAVYYSAYLAPGDTTEALCIKGVADFGDGKKSKEFQKIASVGSFLVFEEIINKLYS